MKNKQFSQGIAVRLQSQEELKELLGHLDRLGYKPLVDDTELYQRTFPWLKTYRGGVYNILRTSLEGNNTAYYISENYAADKDLLFALVAQQSGATIHPGETVVMERAGGWGYHPNNNGCLATVTKVGTNRIGASKREVTAIDGRVLNPKMDYATSFINVPLVNEEGEPLVRKATAEEIITSYPRERKIPVEDKPVLGYRLRPAFEEQRGQIARALDTHRGDTEEGYFLPATGAIWERARTLGVLDLWFEPVVEKFKVGDEVIVLQEYPPEHRHRDVNSLLGQLVTIKEVISPKEKAYGAGFYYWVVDESVPEKTIPIAVHAVEKPTKEWLDQYYGIKVKDWTATYGMVDGEPVVTFGCQSLNEKFVRGLHDVLSWKEGSPTVYFHGASVTLTMVNRILKRFEQLKNGK